MSKSVNLRDSLEIVTSDNLLRDQASPVVMKQARHFRKVRTRLVHHRRGTPVAPPLLIHQRNLARTSPLAHILAGRKRRG